MKQISIHDQRNDCLERMADDTDGQCRRTIFVVEQNTSRMSTSAMKEQSATALFTSAHIK